MNFYHHDILAATYSSLLYGRASAKHHHNQRKHTGGVQCQGIGLYIKFGCSL